MWLRRHKRVWVLIPVCLVVPGTSCLCLWTRPPTPIPHLIRLGSIRVPRGGGRQKQLKVPGSCCPFSFLTLEGEDRQVRASCSPAIGI